MSVLSLDDQFLSDLNSLLRAKDSASSFQKRSNFITKFVGDHDLNCSILLDHFSDAQGSIMLYFHDLN